MFRDELKSIYSHTFSDVIVENVSETVSTQFVPYYVASDVEEKDGRLASEETTDVGEYQWSIFERAGGDIWGCYGPLWLGLICIPK